jgi:hypothetical protein
MDLAMGWFNDMLSSISNLVESEKKVQLKEALRELAYALDDVENEKSRLLMSLKNRNGRVSPNQLAYQNELLTLARTQSDSITKLLRVELQAKGFRVSSGLRSSIDEKGEYLRELQYYNKFPDEKKKAVLAQGDLVVKSLNSANLALVKVIAEL